MRLSLLQRRPANRWIERCLSEKILCDVSFCDIARDFAFLAKESILFP